jgi:hypothetical protein
MSEGKKRNVVWQGRLVEGTPLSLQPAGSEPWSEYLAADGTIIRMKVLITECTRLDGIYDPEGVPMYVCKTQPVFHITGTPEELCVRTVPPAPPGWQGGG